MVKKAEIESGRVDAVKIGTTVRRLSPFSRIPLQQSSENVPLATRDVEFVLLDLDQRVVEVLALDLKLIPGSNL